MQSKRGKSVGVSIQTGEIDDGAVTEAKIADSAVKTNKISGSAVTTGKIQNGTIAKIDLDDDCVDKDKIDAGTETALKVLRLNAAADGIEWGNPALDPDDNITINNITLTLKQWLLL